MRREEHSGYDRVDQLQTWATHIPQVFSGYVACSKSPINTYIQLHIIHTTYFLFGHMSRLQTQGPAGHPPWSMRRLLCQVFYFLKWENQWNPHIKHAYSIHIYIHTGTYRYIQIHYIYIYIYKCIYGPASGGPPLPPRWWWSLYVYVSYIY